MYDNTAEVVPFQIRPLRVETGQHRAALAIYRKSAVGSFSTELACPRDVRFIPDSDRVADISWGPLRAMARRQRAPNLVGAQYLLTSKEVTSGDSRAGRHSLYAHHSRADRAGLYEYNPAGRKLRRRSQRLKFGIVPEGRAALLMQFQWKAPLH